MLEIAFIVGFCALLYFKSLKNQHIVDDVALLQSIKKGFFPKIEKKNLHHIVYNIQRRLYGCGTFYTKRWGYNLELDNAFRIAINALIAVLIYLAFGKSTISLWAAILYLCNPINNQVTLWLNGRRYAVNIIIVLCMMLLGGWGILLYPVTLLYQFTAVFSPLLLARDHPWVLFSIPIIIGLGFTDIKNKIEERLNSIVDLDRRDFTLKRLFIIVKYYGHYFFKMIIPGRCQFIYPLLHYWGRTEKGNQDSYSFNNDFVIGTIALLVSIGGLFIFDGQMRLYWLFMVVSTLQWSAIIPVVGDLADRYVALANVFMMFFVSYVINTYFGEATTPILMGLATYYGTNLILTMRMYQNFPSYWEYHRFYSPKIPMPRNTEAKFYLDKGDPMRAWVLVQEGLKHTPKDYNMLQLAAICHVAVGEVGMARQFALEAKNNYYLYQKESQEPHLNKFLESCNPANIIKTAETPENLSRQQRRALERKGGVVK